MLLQACLHTELPILLFKFDSLSDLNQSFHNANGTDYFNLITISLIKSLSPFFLNIKYLLLTPFYETYNLIIFPATEHPCHIPTGLFH